MPQLQPYDRSAAVIRSRTSRSASRATASGIASIRAILPWMRTLTCPNPISESSASARSTIDSFSSVIFSPYTKREARQASEGLFHVGSPIRADKDRISAFVSPARRSGL